jgi:hypothetical protein
MLLNFFVRNLRIFSNNLANLSSLVYRLSSPRVEHLKGSSTGWAPALPTDIILGWKGLPGTNTLAYYEFPFWCNICEKGQTLQTCISEALGRCTSLTHKY